MNIMKKIASYVLFLGLIAGILSGCSTKTDKTFSCMQDFENARIGALTGSAFDLLAKEYYPKADKLYHMNVSDLIMNLKQDRIDGILMDKGFFTPLGWESDDLSYIAMDMPATEYGIAFPMSGFSTILVEQVN